MANIYTVDKKHFRYTTITPDNIDLDTGRIQISQNYFGHWIKADTSNKDIDLYLPDNLHNGFSCIVENIGQNKINYIVSDNLVLRTDEEKYTDVRYRSVEVNFDKSSNEWRIQGYIGINNINSIYDVKTNQDKVPETGDGLVYDSTTGFWKASPTPRFVSERKEVITSSFSINNRDHTSTIIVNTENNPVNVAIPLDLKPGLTFKVLNISDGNLNLDVAGTLIGPSTTSTQHSYLEVYHLNNNVYYSILVGG